MATHLLKHKQTEKVSPFTDAELEALKQHPDLYNRFEDVTPKTEPAPPELAALTKNGKNTKAQTN